MSGTLALLAAVDSLYQGVVSQPGRWDEQTLADWAQDLALAGPLDRDQARAVRACLRHAGRLREFWASGGAAVEAHDWQARVDVALGPRAWRPTLDLARAGLEREPSPELFEEVRRRFRVVESRHWLEGVGYEEWLASRSGSVG